MSNELVSKTIKFSLATQDDADFIYRLRINEKYNKHLSLFSGDLNTQRQWLVNYKIREQEGVEYYFIIRRKIDDLRIGTVRLYDFIESKQSFCWGSWILTEDKTKSSAIESALLVYQFAFEKLNFKKSHFDVRKENVKVNAFHQKLGATKISENALDYFYEYTRDNYFKQKAKYTNYLI